MRQHPLTPAYALFYLLFSPDTWRIVMGIGLALFLEPRISAGRSLGPAERVVLWIMLACIGWAVSAIPGKRLAALFKRLVLGRKTGAGR